MAPRSILTSSAPSIALGALAWTIGASCAATNDELGGSGPTAQAASSSSSSSSSSASSSTSGVASSSGNAGAAGPGGTGGTGGQGGLGGEGGTGAAGGAGGDPTGTVLLVATSNATVFAAELHAPQASWTSTTLGDASASGPGVALTGESAGVTVIRSTANGGELRYATWMPGVWAPFATVSAGVTTRDRPAIVAGPLAAHVAFQGDDFKHYFASYQAGWLPTAEPVGGAVQQSFGPTPPVITLLGTNPVVAFAGDNGDLFDELRSGAVWQAAIGHGLGDVVGATPAIVPLTQGPDLMIVFRRKTDSQLVWTTRSADVWTVPLAIDSALSNDAPALAALPGGAAAVAFRGLDGKVYAARYTPGAAAPWSLPAGIANPNFTTPSSPALATGIAGADAELAFVDAASGAAYHASLVNLSWSAPNAVGGSGLTHIAIASAP